MAPSGICESSHSADIQQKRPALVPATSSILTPKSSEGFLCTFKEPFDNCDSEKEELRRVFETFDANRDGKLSSDEIRASLAKLGLNMTDKEFASMMVAIDKNGNGFVDLEEFLSLYIMNSDEERSESCIENENEENLKQAFRLFDKDKDGYITAEELQTVFSNLDSSKGDKLADCRHMIRGVDLNGDGQIDFLEFKKMMSRKCGKCSRIKKSVGEKPSESSSLTFR